MDNTTMQHVTCTAPVNIAVIKYWGKRDEKNILPVNSSISVTLDQEQLRAKTTVAASPKFTRDRVWLNGEEQSLNSRVQGVLKEIRRRASKRKADESEPLCDILNSNIHICSENNFPTAAGLASSAAGYACLVFALSKLYSVQGEISDLARRGSGSACRSVYGGFVAWDMGTEADGTDSLARQIAPETHWPDLRVLILVVSGKKKSVGSSDGMQNSVKTSELLKHRAEHILPGRMKLMEKAIRDHDFQTFAEITMKDSNQFHAVCLDTYPPISYMTDTSWNIVRLIHAYNDYSGQNMAAYTFDAGPNACLYLPAANVPVVVALVRHFFPPLENGDVFLQGIDVATATVPTELMESIRLEPQDGAIKYIISTKAGPGPRVLLESDSLMDKEGYPKVVTSQSV